MINWRKIYNFISQHAIAFLVMAVLFYVLIFFGLSWWKYEQLGYDALDLAIYNQVFYNTVHGRWFQSSIHEPTYLGDHLELVILPLSILYSFWQSPVMLLLLQTIFLVLPVWPLYLITKKIIGGRKWPVVFSLIWLINPLLQNANLFEFHILTLAPFFLLWVYYFYLQKKWLAIWGFSLLSLLVREDVSLVIFMFGILIIVDWLKLPKESRKLKELLNGGGFCCLAIIWLILSLKIIGSYAPAGEYKFLAYYSWLGNTKLEMLTTLATKPWLIIQHLLTISNLEMIIGLLLPVMFLPWWSKKELVLLLGPLAQLMLGAPGGSALILQTHYNLLMLPALLISSIWGLRYFLNNLVGQNSRWQIIRILAKERGFLILVFVVGLLYVSLSLGPLVGSVDKLFTTPANSKLLSIKKSLAAQIPPNASVATTYNYLPYLSSRQNIYSMHYEFIGKKQFSNIDYNIPQDTEYLLIDFYDVFLYQLQFPQNSIYNRFFNLADERLKKLLQNYKLVTIFDNQALFKLSTEPEESKLFTITDQKPKYEQRIALQDKIDFIGWQFNNQKLDNQLTAKNLLPLSLFWQAKTNLASNDVEIPAENYELKLLVTNSNGDILHQQFYPLGYGALPTAEWPQDKIVQTNYWFYVPEKLFGQHNLLQLAVVKVKGFIALNSLRQGELKSTEEFLGPLIAIKEL